MSRIKPVTTRRHRGSHIDLLCDLLKHLRVTGGASRRQLIESDLIGRNAADLWLRQLVENGLVLRNLEPCEFGTLRSHYVYRLAPAWVGKP